MSQEEKPFSTVTYVPIEYAGTREVIMLIQHQRNMRRVIDNTEYRSHIANGSTIHFVNELNATEAYLTKLKAIQTLTVYE